MPPPLPPPPLPAAISLTKYLTREGLSFTSSPSQSRHTSPSLFKSLCVNNGTVIIFHYLGRQAQAQRSPMRRALSFPRLAPLLCALYGSTLLFHFLGWIDGSKICVHKYETIVCCHLHSITLHTHEYDITSPPIDRTGITCSYSLSWTIITYCTTMYVWRINIFIRAAKRTALLHLRPHFRAFLYSSLQTIGRNRNS